MSEVDISNDKAAQHVVVFNSAAAILRKLRSSHPDYIVDLIMMVLPKLGPPRGACSLLPLGLGPPALAKALTDGEIGVLLSTSEGTVLFDSLRRVVAMSRRRLPKGQRLWQSRRASKSR
eukprot:3641164-Heterocapsa_arctica.AAC.1